MKNNFLTLTLALALLLLASCGPKDTSTTLVGNWVNRTEYQFSGTPRGGAVCFVIDNKAYMGLGYNGKNYPKDFFVMDLDKGTWTKLEHDFPALGRERAVAFAIGKKGYVGLGYNRDDVGGLKNGGKDFYSYDPNNDQWLRMTDFLGSARYDAIAFAVGGNGYVGTGLDKNGYYCNDMFQYDPGANSWKPVANFAGGKKYRAFALSLNNVAYVGGGYSSGSFNNDFWKFDGKTWTSLKPSTDASYWAQYAAAVNRADANIFSISGKIYIANGVGSSSYNILKTCYEWDPSKADNAWVQKQDFERSGRQLAVAFTLGNRGFVCAGQNSASYWDDTSEFLPDDAYNQYD